LNPQAVRDRLALPGRPHSAFVRSITAPDVAPFIEPTGRALVVGARVAILGSSATQALARGAIL
jgi:hypothetical protein